MRLCAHTGGGAQVCEPGACFTRAPVQGRRHANNLMPIGKAHPARVSTSQSIPPPLHNRLTKIVARAANVLMCACKRAGQKRRPGERGITDKSHDIFWHGVDSRWSLRCLFGPRGRRSCGRRHLCRHLCHSFDWARALGGTPDGTSDWRDSPAPPQPQVHV